MHYKSLLFVLAFFIFNLPIKAENEDEIIRRHIENASFQPIEAFNTPLYCTQSLTDFYISRAFQPAWNTNMTEELVQAIQEAENEGLTPNNYHFSKLKSILFLQNSSAQNTAELDLLLSDAFLLYTSHLSSGKVNPQTIDADWQVTRREGNPVELLQKAIDNNNVLETIRNTAPNHRVYTGLKQALKKYKSIDITDWQAIEEGTTLKQGMQDARVIEIKKRLALLGDLKTKELLYSDLFDDSMFEAVSQFQNRHGLDADGNIGTKTIRALNISIPDRIDQIKVNLERWRWLPQTFSDYYLKVNIANYLLEVVIKDSVVKTYKVMVGKPFRRTPVFSANIKYLVFNPTWTVPPSILSNDILPAARKNPGYLASKNISVTNNQGIKLDPSTIDFSSSQAKSYTYTQSPGVTNALGAVKFMFPNKYHIYLHDTPSKELFLKTDRAFSSGCIRVEKPLELAEFLLNNSTWNQTKINAVIASKQTQTVTLDNKPNVYLLYWTSWINSDGKVQFREDIYARDMPLKEALNSLSN